ncbi:uncharacterized protein LOC107273477 [Cephus cinctus]|uniref:Uncharacterized protein LOC107273477 n=1 Tax=Cephus cinctus TaxID=211228 RepID=A0AAJ7CCG0_CEPCN|nr:uncharacterized protein LOC107273477 [Cephus cinctus]
MRKIFVIPLICAVSLLCCRFVKSVNDTHFHDKSIEESEETETTTMDTTTVTKITETTETTRKTTKMPTESSNSNLTTEKPAEKVNSEQPSETIVSNDNTKGNWMKVKNSIRDDLMNVQAILVKDEEVTKQCQTANLEAKTRYLMCGGSIISDHHVLTSASCIHEATHIRHNIKAPLAVVIAPTKSGSQIIRVQDYVIHPNHQDDPHKANHLDHNLAILKLACRIKSNILKKVKLPESPFTEICGDGNCMATFFRKLGKSSYRMYEITAENIPLSKRKRDQSAVLWSTKVSSVTEGPGIDKKRNNREVRKLIHPPTFDISFAATGAERANRNWLKVSSDTDNTKKANTQSTIVSTSATTITEKTTRKMGPMKTTDKSIINNNSVKSIMTRASDGTSRCPSTGTPVMSEDVQTALVSVPCDDRQPFRAWGYTDLFVNIDWINHTVENLKKPEKPASENVGTGPCHTCIFNFYFAKGHDQKYGSSEKPDCSKVITIASKDNGLSSNIMQSLKIRVLNDNNKNPIVFHSNFGAQSGPALPTAYAAAPAREYRSNADSIDQTSNDDNRRSTMEKRRNVTGNCTPEPDILGMGLNGKMTQIKKASLATEIRDNTLMERMKFFNFQNQKKTIQNQSQRDMYTEGQDYGHYIDKEPNVVPEASKTIFPRGGGKFENQQPRLPVRSTENRAKNNQSDTSPLDAANATLLYPNLRGFFKDPKKLSNYPEIMENSNTDDSPEDHMIIVKLRIEEPRYDPLKTSSEVEEAILKNMSVMIDGDRSKNSEIYVNGKSLKDSEIYVYGERTRKSRNYRENRDFRYSSKTTQIYQIDRTTDKSITWANDRIVRLPSSTGYATRQERQSYAVNKATVETRNYNNGHPGRPMEFSDNVANLRAARKQDLHELFRKNRQKGRD